LTVIDKSKSDVHFPARGYQANDEATALEDGSDHFIFGATGFRATPTALTNLISGFFSDEYIKEANRQQILDSIQDETFEVVTPENVYPWPVKIGLGIEEVQISLNSGEIIKVYGHGGWQNTHASFMVFDPQDGSSYACCFSKTFGLEKIYESRLQALFKQPFHSSNQSNPYPENTNINNESNEKSSTNPKLNQWLPSPKQAILGISFLAVGGLFAYGCARKGAGLVNSLADSTKLIQPRGPS
jgi:hypothetical protein